MKIPQQATEICWLAHLETTGLKQSLTSVRGFRKGNCLSSSVLSSKGRRFCLMAAIFASMHMERADDLFGGPEGSPRTDKLIAASVQWAEKIMEKIDNAFGKD